MNDVSTDNYVADRSVQVSIDEYASNPEEIIKRARPLSSQIIFVGLSACDELRTMPVAWGDFYYTNEAICSYEGVMSRVAKENDIPFIPVFDRFKQALDNGADYLSDGLHPNDKGHQFMAEVILPLMQRILKK